MKATEQQIRFARIIIVRIEAMLQSNDIDSQNQFTLNKELSGILAEKFIDDTNHQLLVATELSEVFDKILNLIKSI